MRKIYNAIFNAIISNYNYYTETMKRILSSEPKSKHKYKHKSKPKTLFSYSIFFVLIITMSLAIFLFAKDSCYQYFSIWSLHQWWTSLLALFVYYYLTTVIFNKYLSRWGGWMSVKARTFLLILDLFINFSLGIYYMSYRETMIGDLMRQCPIALSPFIMAIEFLLFLIYWIYRIKLENQSKVKTSPDVSKVEGEGNNSNLDNNEDKPNKDMVGTNQETKSKKKSESREL